MIEYVVGFGIAIIFLILTALLGEALDLDDEDEPLDDWEQMNFLKNLEDWRK